MKYKKSIIVLLLAIFLFSITSVCASEIETPIASEDTSQVGLSDSDKVDEDNPQTSEEKLELGVDDEILNEQTDTDVLGDSPAKYSDLAEEINTLGNITLKHKSYTYNNGTAAITVSEDNKVIDGNGAVIDMAGSTIRAFTVSASGVTIKNLTIKNANYNSDGGAIYFSNSGTVTNCNFTNNSARYGGAIYMYSGTVTNCNFTDNSASEWGGAVYFEGTGNVTNCNFTGNNATNSGGAIYMDSGTVKNCNFTNNKAKYSGSINIYSGSVENCNFINNSASSDGGAICFSDTGTVTNCNFTGNNAATGSAIYFWSASASKTVSNSRFLNNRANSKDLVVTKNDNNITITFTGNDNLLNAIYSNGEVSFTNVTYWGANGIANTGSSPTIPSGSNKEAGQNITVGVVVNDKLVSSDVIATDENGMIVLHIIAGDNYYITARHDADSYYTEAEKTISNNTKFNVNVTSQTTHNKTVNITAKSNIFSEFMEGKLLFILPNGVNVSANYAGNGAWWILYTFGDYDDYLVNATYVGLDNVTVNNATIKITKADSAIIIDKLVYDYGDSNITVSTDGATGITAVIDGNDVTVTGFTVPLSGLKAGNHSLTVTTVPDEDHNNVTKTVNITINKVESTLIIKDVELDWGENRNITVTTEGAIGITAKINDNDASVSGFTINIADLKAGTYTLSVTTVADENHTEVTRNSTILVNKVDSTLKVDDVELDWGESKIVTVTAENALGITAKIDSNEVTVTGFTIPVSGLNAGTHTLTVTTVTDENHTQVTRNATITVNKIDSTLTINNNIIFDYTGSGSTNVSYTNAIGVDACVINQPKAVVNVDGNNITVSGLDAGSYILSVTTITDGNHNPVTVNATVTVNKLKTELTANPLTTTYNVNSYLVITLKDSNGRALSGIGLVVDLGGAKTYTTDNNGQVKVFTKSLAAKTYNARITFNANTNYDASSKDVKVTVNKAANPLKVKGNTVKVKFSKLKKKTQKLKVTKVVKFTKKGQGTLTYKKVKGNKKISINKKTGKVTIKKGLKKGTYKVKLKIKAKGNANYKASAFKTVTFKIKIK